MSKSLKRVRRVLDGAEVAYDLREMPASTRTAAEAAAAIGCEIDQIAKSIVFRAEDEVVLFLTAGGRQVAVESAANLAGSLERADADFVRKRTGFAIGGVAPVGHLAPVRSFWDPHLDLFDTVWAAAGTPHHVFGISPSTLRALTNATSASFSIGPS